MRRTTVVNRLLLIGVGAFVIFGVGCQRLPTTLVAEPIDVPAPAGSVVPQVITMTGGDVVLSWLEPRNDKGFRFRAAIRRGAQWDDSVTIDDSPAITMFSANLPGIAELPGGAWFAYWERADTKAVDEPYSTAIQLSRSVDKGRTWAPLPSPHRDGVSGMHSFLSAFVAGSELGLVWLDAQKQRHIHTPAVGAAVAKDEWLGAVGLRCASFGPDGQQQADTFIDPITCECCPTAAAVTTSGPVVVYRDRVAPPGTGPQDIRYETATVRDISLVRLERGRWTEPRRVHADNWVINGCPDNGPAVDAHGNNVVVAWWTRAGDQPKVYVAFSSNAGDSFGEPIRVDSGNPEGQVTVAWTSDKRAAVVGWLEDHKVWARWVNAEGRSGNPSVIGNSPPHSRLPRWVARNGSIFAVWTAQDGSGPRSVKATQLTMID
jgi:hypothetical protein